MSVSEDYRPYIVRQGDHLARLAYVHGFDATEVWNHENNNGLREMGRKPELLAPGDILYLPGKPKESLAFYAGTSNRYQARVPVVNVALAFKDADQVLSDEPYEIHGLGTDGSDGQTEERKTDSEGKVSLELPVTTREVTIVFPRQNIAYEVRVGDMDPVAEMSGIQKRLENLGYLPRDREGGFEGAYLQAAIAEFQKRHGLAPTGTLDDNTSNLLKDEHGL
jgi:Putative peptidoglycan binding domain